ncbi:HNH endonuclease [Bradyrhizobium sp. USDA 4452]
MQISIDGTRVPAGHRSPEWFLRSELSHMLWKPVPGFLDYEVSERGDVRRGPAHLKPERTNGNGRKRFSLSKGGRLYRMKAHQLVALAFLGPAPFEGAEVCHKDGFHHNNHYSNLRWGTSADNGNDVTKHRLQRLALRSLPASKSETISAEAARFLENR